jgi:NAD(P)-dependent dehydrogenase (short-subunit alcohol dehydrogenase family)
MLLDGKSALVTGGGSGIGRCIAMVWAREGACVTVADINEATGRETVELVEAMGGRAIFCRADVSDPEAHAIVVGAAKETFGALHIACNNAGIDGGAGAEFLPIAKVPIETWTRVIAVNLSGVFYGMRAQIPALLESGGGAIINMASIMSQVSMAGTSPYTASKHGVLGITVAAALEYSSQGVRINAVAPGFIDTPLLASISEEEIESIKQRHPIGRLGRPEEVAELVLWLSSSGSSFATGALYRVDGGYMSM